MQVALSDNIALRGYQFGEHILQNVYWVTIYLEKIAHGEFDGKRPVGSFGDNWANLPK